MTLKLTIIPLFLLAAVARADPEKFEPQLDLLWNSSYGVIHWEDGWYGVEENTIRITAREWDAARRVYAVRGVWGRVSTPDYKGTFRFEFSKPDAFSGWWSQDGSESQSAWEGTAIPPTPKVPADAQFVPDLDVPWNSDYGPIHWKEGWYGVKENTLRITASKWDAARRVYVIKGVWGRVSAPDDKGKFRFKFSRPDTFSGWWSQDGSKGHYAWEGTAIPPTPKVPSDAKFVPALDVPWNSDYGPIHWNEGWYGVEEHTIQITAREWDSEKGAYVVRGFWGRRSSPATKGLFEFKFSDPITFTGGWSNSSDGHDFPFPWSGKLPQ